MTTAAHTWFKTARVSKRCSIQATHIISTEMPSVPVIGLSMYHEADGADLMRGAGAVDYLCKSGPTENLIAAIRKATMLSHVFP